MKKKSFSLLIAFVVFVWISCGKITPAGFWADYQSRLLKQNISDQGPWGGHRAMYWKATGDFIFSTYDIIKFAGKNGWQLVDSLQFTAPQTSKWMYFSRPVFPLTSTGFSDTAYTDAITENFPRWFDGQINIYSFTTGRETIEPGTEKHTETNGFVVLSQDKTAMAVYHLWGE